MSRTIGFEPFGHILNLFGGGIAAISGQPGRDAAMAKKPSTAPMECQRFHFGDAQPMARAPTERTKTPKAMASAIADGKADATRQRSLRAQRAQISKYNPKN
jgi:hypothetical protein